jgi:hypothetical protein
MQIKACGLEADEVSYRMHEALQMAGRFQSHGSRGKRLARGALRLVVAVAAVAFLTLATARESQACAGAETSAAAAALETILVAFVVDPETASISTAQAVVENLKCCGAGSHHRSGAPCSSGHCSACWMAVPIVGIAIVSPDDFADHVLKRDFNFLPTGQTSKFRPPCIIA